MPTLLALTPIALILFLMVGRRWGAARAGAAGYLITLPIAALYFGADLRLFAYAHTRALFLSLDVLLIIWAAFLLYRVADEAGAIATIGRALPHLTADPGMQALVIGWVFAGFLQGVGGFGVPVAVISPILVGLGFAPLAAVVIPSLGHGWSVTFGSLGSSFQALMAATGLSQEALAPPAAMLLGIAGLGCGIMVAHAAGGFAAIRRLWLPILALGLVMGIIQYLVATAGFWNIGAFAAGTAGLLAAYPLARRFRGQANPDGPVSLRPLAVAASGYVLLVGIILLFELTPGLKTALGRILVLQVDFPEITTRAGYITPAGFSRRIALFSHTGLILVYAACLTYLVYLRAGLYRSGSIGRILSSTLKSVIPSSVSIVSMVTMATIMQQAGMTDQVARALASGTGAAFPLVSPWIGGLGAFMTGSNTNSNVVFATLQMRTAQLLSLPLARILAAQTAGAALASVMAPAKVVVGASTAGMAGREGDVLRTLIVYTGLLLALASAITLISVTLA